jgi:tetratricopeptide (TPR) repeat protein
VQRETERKLQKLLLKNSDVKLVAERLMSDPSFQNDAEAQLTVFAFLYNSGQFQKLAELITERSQKLISAASTEDSRWVASEPIPWSLFGEILCDLKAEVPQDTEVAFWQGVELDGQQDHVLRVLRLENILKEFKERRVLLLSQRLIKFAEKKAELRQQLDFLRANRMHQQEAKVLDEVQGFFPNEPEFEDERKHLEVRIARDVLQRTSPETDINTELAFKVDQITPDLAAVRKLLSDSAESFMVKPAETVAATLITNVTSVGDKKPSAEIISDLAVAMLSMEMHSEAIAFLDRHDISNSYQWLKLELHLRGRQYATALDECSKIEVSLAENPETVFAITYARARALWGLQSREPAIQLLTSLTKIRPGFRSAQSLLREWTGGDV